MSLFNRQASLLALVLFAALPGLARAGQEGHGGDAFEMPDGSYKVFDKIEYDTPIDFDDPQYRAESAVIESNLAVLVDKLPRAGGYLKAKFKETAPLWWLVDATLKDIDDEGETPIHLVYKKVQAAATDGNHVIVAKEIWTKLSPESRSYLRVHETLWSATEAKVRRKGASIRALTGLLVSRNLKELTSDRIAEQILSELEPNAKLAVLLKEDTGTYLDGIASLESKLKLCVKRLQREVPGLRAYRLGVSVDKGPAFFQLEEGRSAFVYIGKRIGEVGQRTLQTYPAYTRRVSKSHGALDDYYEEHVPAAQRVLLSVALDALYLEVDVTGSSCKYLVDRKALEVSTATSTGIGEPLACEKQGLENEAVVTPWKAIDPGQPTAQVIRAYGNGPAFSPREVTLKDLSELISSKN